MLGYTNVKKRISKYVLIMVLFIALLMVLTPTVFAEVDLQNPGIAIIEDIFNDGDFLAKEAELRSQFDHEYLKAHDDAVIKYFNVIESFGTCSDGDITFPDYYGGCYIDGNGFLNVYVLRIYDILDSELNEFLQMLESNGIYIKEAQYSYNELTEMMNTLYDYWISSFECSIAENYNMFYLSDVDNRIIVELDDFTSAQIHLFNQYVTSSSMVLFAQSTGPVTLDSNVNPGAQLYDISMGYRARRNGLNGLVTAAHGTQTQYDGVHVYVGNQTIVGVVNGRKFSGSVDAAFVQTETHYTPTNNLGNGAVLSTSTSRPPSGTLVNKIGYRTGLSTGTIISSSVAMNVSGVYLTNLTSTNYNSLGGDSGGIVYATIGSPGIRYTLGIHTSQNSAGTTRYYTKADEINSALGTTRY